MLKLPFSNSLFFNSYNTLNNLNSNCYQNNTSHPCYQNDEINDIFDNSVAETFCKESLQNSFDTQCNSNNYQYNKKNEIPNNFVLDIFGFRLYFDDLILLCVLYFLYKEQVEDNILYMVLFLLLFD